MFDEEKFEELLRAGDYSAAVAMVPDAVRFTFRGGWIVIRDGAPPSFIHARAAAVLERVLQELRGQPSGQETR